MHRVVIVTDHTAFDWQEIANHTHLIVDTRNVMSNISGKAEVISL
jgi:UDP-N-acetyl-D-mannosaminuronate dehydrogenase